MGERLELPLTACNAAAQPLYQPTVCFYPLAYRVVRHSVFTHLRRV